MAQDTVVAEKAPVLTAAQIRAGAAYLASLRELGFDPEILCWVYLEPEGEFQLALVTSLVDRIGSKAIYDVLFMAHDGNATPKEIHPFALSVYSPKTELGRDLSRGLAAIRPDPARRASKPGDGMVRVGVGVPKLVPRSGVYAAREPHQDRQADMQRWRELERRVRGLAG